MVEIYKNSVQTNHLNTIFSEIVEKGLNQQRQTAQTLAAQGFSVLSQLYHQGILMLHFLYRTA